MNETRRRRVMIDAGIWRLLSGLRCCGAASALLLSLLPVLYSLSRNHPILLDRPTTIQYDDDKEISFIASFLGK
jgi:hypothetical protein